VSSNRPIDQVATATAGAAGQGKRTLINSSIFGYTAAACSRHDGGSCSTPRRGTSPGIRHTMPLTQTLSELPLSHLILEPRKHILDRIRIRTTRRQIEQRRVDGLDHLPPPRHLVGRQVRRRRHAVRLHVGDGMVRVAKSGDKPQFHQRLGLVASDELTDPFGTGGVFACQFSEGHAGLVVDENALTQRDFSLKRSAS